MYTLSTPIEMYGTRYLMNILMRDELTVLRNDFEAKRGT